MLLPNPKGSKMFQRKDRLLLMADRGRFLVTLEAEPEETVEGILLEWDEQFIVLGDAYAIAANGDRLQLDRELWIPRGKIKYMQRAQHRTT
jgi:hypothetical protein